jgi:hypothetical protein
MTMTKRPQLAFLGGLKFVQGSPGRPPLERDAEGGHVFSELASFSGSPRSASVQAVEEGEVLHLTNKNYDEIRRRDPDLACPLAFEFG